METCFQILWMHCFLIQPDGSGPVPNRTGTYELVMFTRQRYSEDTAEKEINKRISSHLCSIMTAIGNYSSQEKIEPRETAELPQSDRKENLCLIFDEFCTEGKKFKIGEKDHGLLLIIEVFRDEMEYAMDNGGQKVLDMLKAKGHYPYSDLNRKSVLEK